MTQRFAGKVALVTGATRGIGAATVRRLVRQGARVAFCGRTNDAGNALAEELGGPEHVLYVAADLARPDDCAMIVDDRVVTLTATGVSCRVFSRLVAVTRIALPVLASSSAE